MDGLQVSRDLSGARLTATSGARREHLLDQSDLTVRSGLEGTQVARLEPELLQPYDRLEDLQILGSEPSARVPDRKSVV